MIFWFHKMYRHRCNSESRSSISPSISNMIESVFGDFSNIDCETNDYATTDESHIIFNNDNLPYFKEFNYNEHYSDIQYVNVS